MNRRSLLAPQSVLAVALALTAPLFFASAARAQASPSQNVTVGEKETGLAAVYTTRLNHHITSSGQVYNSSLMTASHKSLPYGTKIRVTNQANHKTAILRINDRGPVQQGRLLDISSAAAHKLGIPRNVMRPIELEVLSVGNGKTTRQ